MKPTTYTVESLLARTVEEGECLLWTGFHASNGVPMVRHAGKWQGVRKLFTQLIKGETKPGYYVAKCGNDECVKPDHTKHRTTKEHMRFIQTRPRTAAARLRMLKRRRDSNVKLTIEQAREIRAAEGFNHEIAPKYGVSAEMVRRIRNGDAWKEYANPFAGLMG